MAKKTFQRITLTAGIAGFLNLVRADTKYKDAGTYKASQRLTIEEAKPYIKQIQAIAKEHTGSVLKLKDNPCWTFETDEEGEELGTVLFKAKVNNIIKKDGTLWDRKPVMFDASGRPVTGINPTAGSKISMAFDVYTYDKPEAGLNLQLTAVQIIELVNFDGSSASQDASEFGFGAVDGGFVKAEDEADDTVEGETKDPAAVDDEYDF